MRSPNRIELPTLMKYERGSRWRGFASAKDLLLGKWRRHSAHNETTRRMARTSE